MEGPELVGLWITGGSSTKNKRQGGTSTQSKAQRH
jgi:hypothetical protein